MAWLAVDQVCAFWLATEFCSAPAAMEIVIESPLGALLPLVCVAVIVQLLRNR